MIKNILVAYDGSRAAERAFTVATDIAKALGARLRVVTVVALPSEDYSEAQPVELEGERDWVANAQAELVERVAGAFPIDTDIAYGPPAPAILEQAEAHATDLIVVGRTGKGLLERALIGSVSRHVLDHAQVAVMLVPDRAG